MAQASDILLFLAMLVLGWVLFVFWLVTMALRGLWRGWTMLSGTGGGARADAAGARRCTRLRCRALNPAKANYCRRCGAPLAVAGGQRRDAAKPRLPRWVS
jgi:hypothetical protein